MTLTKIWSQILFADNFQIFSMIVDQVGVRTLWVCQDRNQILFKFYKFYGALLYYCAWETLWKHSSSVPSKCFKVWATNGNWHFTNKFKTLWWCKQLCDWFNKYSINSGVDWTCSCHSVMKSQLWEGEDESQMTKGKITFASTRLWTKHA